MNTQTKNSKTITTFKILQKNFSKTIIFPLKKYIFNEKYKLFILFIPLALLAADIFSSSANSDVKFFGITILFFITAFFYQLKSRVTFAICLVLLILMYINFLLSGTSDNTEKIAVWLFLFMVVGIMQQWRE